MMPATKIYVCFFPYVVRNDKLFTNTLRFSRTKKQWVALTLIKYHAAKNSIHLLLQFVGFKLRKPVKYL